MDSVTLWNCAYEYRHVQQQVRMLEELLHDAEMRLADKEMALPIWSNAWQTDVTFFDATSYPQLNPIEGPEYEGLPF